jgi:hypothetical protein
MRSRAALRIAAVTALLAAGAAPVARAAPSRFRGWTITRTGRAAIPIDGWLHASATSEEGYVTMVALLPRGTRPRTDGRFMAGSTSWGVDGWAQVHADGVPVPACPAACETPVGVPTNISIYSNHQPLRSTIYIAAHDVLDATFTISSPGWVVRPWQPTLRLLTTATAAGTRVSAAGETYGTYTGGELPGGRYGSTATADLPCSSHGSGWGVLTGSGRRSAMSCPVGAFTFDQSPGPARWRVEADVVGWGPDTILLAVLDFPPG